ncbi:MAG: hypothetical protein QOK48_2133 [Blastocatellia bacterium]|jgi:hypothetical protein|nr:hypothetical protein [Blastocatellia bacterium]
MTNRIRIESSVQTADTLRAAFRAWCEHCQDVVVALQSQSDGSLQELIELGQHPVELNVVRSMVCGGSAPAIKSGEASR